MSVNDTMQCRVYQSCSCVVPYGQAVHSETGENKQNVLAWSPDHAKLVTFRSQKTDDLIIIIVDQSQENRRPAVNFLARSGDRRERLRRR